MQPGVPYLVRAPYIGAILVGGLSSRMGRPKERILLSDGRPMIEHIIETMLKLSPKLILVGPDGLEYKRNRPNIMALKDNNPGGGPLSGIEALLSSGIAPGYIVCGCDQPLLSADLLKRLVPDDPTMPVIFEPPAGYPLEPLPAYYPENLLADVRDGLRKNRKSLKAILADNDVQFRDMNEKEASLLQSINTPEDLSKLLAKSGN